MKILNNNEDLNLLDRRKQVNYDKKKHKVA